MKNSGWMVVVGMFAFALMLAGCGSGDGENGETNGDDTTPGDDVGPGDDTVATCGNRTCETGEGCTSCVNDCACLEQYTTCRNDACVDWDTINPLLKKLPGHWVREDGETTDVTVDPLDSNCGVALVGYGQGPNPNEPGDACVLGFAPTRYVLDGSLLRVTFPDGDTRGRGQILNEGTRVEVVDIYRGNEYPHTYERQ